MEIQNTNPKTDTPQGIKSRITSIASGIKKYFNISDDLEDQKAIEESIRSGVTFKGSQLLMLIFAIVIASLGLNTNSIPVIIGAMLISPLMGPIIGMGFALGVQDFRLLKRGLKNITMAVVGSLLASAIYFLISPQYEGAGQLLARTSPSIYDVFIGFFGGAAGILSIAARNKGQVMPGVAIATSLMPPLCTAGYGLATLQMQFFLGALYLFLTNMIFILIASWVGVKSMGFKRKVYQDRRRYIRIRTTVYSVVFIMLGISAWLTFGMIRKNIFISKASDFVKNEMVFPNTQVLSHDEYVEHGKRHIDVTLIGESLSKDSLQLAMMKKMDSIGLGGTMLNIKQGFSITNQTKNVPENFDRFYAIMQNELESRQQMVDSLRMVIASKNVFSDESRRISPEVKVLFPTIKDIALSQMVASNVTDGGADTINMIFVNAPAGLNPSDRSRLTKYVGVRLGENRVNLTINPEGFPWPSTKQDQ